VGSNPTLSVFIIKLLLTSVGLSSKKTSDFLLLNMPRARRMLTPA